MSTLYWTDYIVNTLLDSDYNVNTLLDWLQCHTLLDSDYSVKTLLDSDYSVSTGPWRQCQHFTGLWRQCQHFTGLWLQCQHFTGLTTVSPPLPPSPSPLFPCLKHPVANTLKLKAYSKWLCFEKNAHTTKDDASHTDSALLLLFKEQLILHLPSWYSASRT